MISASYVIYRILWAALLFGGCGYVVFWLGHSGWWFLAVVAIHNLHTTRPDSWADLWRNDRRPPEKDCDLCTLNTVRS